MKFLAVLPVAVVLALSGVTSASAAPLAEDFLAEGPEAYVHRDANGHPYHHCHGRSSGTASAACGTLTGGPSGGDARRPPARSTSSRQGPWPLAT